MEKIYEKMKKENKYYRHTILYSTDESNKLLVKTK